MTPSTYKAPSVAEPRTFSRGYVFGAPVKDLGWFASVIMGLATGFMAFFFVTFLGIVAILIWRESGHPAADFTLSYKWMGLPAGLLMAVLSLAYLGTFWVKRIARKATGAD
jgi:hypothetical protein